MQPIDQARVALGQALQRAGYEFVTPTPATHARVVARRHEARTLRDVLGWNLPFARHMVSEEIFDLMQRSEILTQAGALWRASVRFSSLPASPASPHDLFMHSAYPTTCDEAVFFGPDTYRFAAMLQRVARPAKRCVDMGCGSGAGALSIRSRLSHVVLSDVNPQALRFAAVNAALCGCPATVCESDVLAGIHGPVDLVIANPPYMIDESARTYRHGGGDYGTELAVRMLQEGLQRLIPGGQIIVYTGAPVVDGTDIFWARLADVVGPYPVEYAELDPDVFGEELEHAAYSNVERIAAVYVSVMKI